MEEKLDFSLPERKQSKSVAGGLAIVLLVILIILTSVNLLIKPTSQPAVSGKRSSGLTVEQTKQLAVRLALRNLYQQGAKVWQDYLSFAELSDTERAKALFQAGTLLEKAGSLEEAIEYYYRSEMAAKLDELEPQINTHIKGCFEKLGKFSALRYELMDRTGFKQTQPAGTKILAEIGAEKITQSDLDATIESSIDNQLSPMAPFMTPEQLNEQKDKMLEQYKNPEAKQQFLQMWLAQEILYRQALEEKLTEEPQVKKVIDELSKRALSQYLMNRELASRINITETDLQTYYAANKSKYIEPAKVKISHILVEDQQQADDLLKRIKDGEDFAGLAEEFSIDKGTRENGGRINADVTAGSYIPVIGESKELNEKIFATEAGSLIDEAVKTEKGLEIVKVESKTPERQKSFDEAAQQVMSELSGQKRQDVQQEYIKKMMDKFGVIIHTSAFMPEGQSEK